MDQVLQNLSEQYSKQSAQYAELRRRADDAKASHDSIVAQLKSAEAAIQRLEGAHQVVTELKKQADAAQEKAKADASSATPSEG